LTDVIIIAGQTTSNHDPKGQIDINL